ncbi:SDR family oxidoreductase [Streptomyces sp. bgisy100]|uniref:SDR family oxidoreductase n=1 Tax=Streptomyces sp. bgisy100 TaxID=3413783 RepID=UPI003D70D474
MNGTVLVTGGTGTLGRAVVRRLLDDGRPVRVLSRRPRAEADRMPYTWATGDLRTGEGLDAALDGVTAVIHCATANGRGDVEATRLLTEAAQRAGRPHLVYISIVGIDRLPLGYYRAKLAAERLIEHSGLPWTVLRATQFHDLVARMTSAQRRLPVVLTVAGVRFQPVDVREVADRLAELAAGPAAGRVADMGGPEIRDATDLARSCLRAAGVRRRVVPLRLPGALVAGLRRGGNLVPDRAVGRITFEEFLAGPATGATRPPQQGVTDPEKPDSESPDPEKPDSGEKKPGEEKPEQKKPEE